MFVWYTLVGSTVGLLAVTLGRLYSNAFYALGDPKTPLRFAVLRVILTGVLGYLFAIPLRPAMLSLLRAANIPLPLVNGSDVPLGVIGLTASAGLAGWLEFWMLRRALARRTGAVRLPVGYLARLWLAAVIGGGIAIAISLFGRDVMTRLPLHRIATAAIVATVFGLTYLGATLALGVPEAGATVRRFRGR
jgi:putative peptidoglycan lipid II flippase